MISIHTVLADCDTEIKTETLFELIFQSTQSSQTVTTFVVATHPTVKISIHTVLADCDVWPVKAKSSIKGFQSTQSSQTVTAIMHDIYY